MLFGGSLAFSFAAPRASASACAVEVDVVPAQVSSEWRVAIDDLRAQLAQASDCARGTLSIARATDGANVRFVTPDGRVAERHVRRPADLAPIALGLVTTIPGETPAPSASSAPTSEPEPPEMPPFEKPVPKAARERDARFVFALGAGARVGQPTRVLFGDLEASAEAVVGDAWLLAATARVGAIGTRLAHPSIPSYQYNEYAFGVALGRRFRAAGPLDVFATGTFVIAEEEGGKSGEPNDTASGGITYARVGLRARWLPLRVGAWRFGATVDGELAPFDIKAAPALDVALPSLPTWAFGARLTATAELP